MRKALTLLLLSLLLALPVLAQAPPAEQALGLANGLYDQELWDQALDKYEAFLKDNPQSPNLAFALFRAGECHFSRQRYDKALPLYQRVTTEFATATVFAEALYRLGDAHFHLEHFPEAQQAFAALLDKAPQNPLAYRAAYWLGEALYRQGKFAEAAAAYDKSLQLSPNGNYSAYASYSIALCKLKANDTRDGLARLEAILTQYPGHELLPEVLYRLGEAQYGAKNYEAALARYQQVLKDYPATKLAPLAQSGLAWSYWSLGKYAEALPVFEQLRQAADPALAPEAALRAADCLFLLQKYAEAATAYGGLATGKTPQAPLALFWQAMSLERKPDKGAALTAFQKFVTENPTHERAAEACLHLGALQVEAGQLKAAAEAYKTAEARATDAALKGQARYGAAWATYQQSKADTDLAAIEKIADEAPEGTLSAQVAYQTGKLRFVRGDYSRAIQLLSLLVQHHPQDPNLAEALYLLGAAYDKAANAAKAEEFYKRTVEGYPQSEWAPAASGGLIALYAKAGQLEQARTAMEALKKAYPTDKALVPAQYSVAEALLAAGKYADAGALYTEVLAAQNADLAPYAQYSLGACRFGMGDYQAAAEAFGVVPVTYPKSEAVPAAKYQLAICQGKLGRPAEAIKLLDELLTTYPKSELADRYLIELGWANLELKQPQQALGQFQKLLTDFPQSAYAAEACFRSGEIRYDSGDFAGAQASYQKLLADYPKSDLADEAAYKLGWALLKQDKLQEALPPFRTAADSASDAAVGADARYQAAAILSRQSAFEEVVTLLAPVRDKLPPGLASRTLLLLGQAYLGLKDTAKAVPCFQQIVTQFADDPLATRALLGLGRCQKMEKKYEEAATTFTKVTGARDPQSAMEAQFELAETRRLQGDFRGAAMEYLKVAILYQDAEWGARAQYAAGLCYEQAQAIEEALKAYKVVLERYKGQEEWATKATERIKALQ